MKKPYLPYNPSLKLRARLLRKNLTPFEKKLWFDFLAQHHLKFTKQKPISEFIVDFYCASKNLVIEIDGDSHSEEVARIYDERRTKKLNQLGLKVIRFSNLDVRESFEWVCLEIDRVLDE